MPNAQVQEFIEREMAAGQPRASIKTALLQRGWPEPAVDQALNLLGAHHQPKKHQQRLPPSEKSPGLRTTIMLALLLALILGAALYYLFFRLLMR